MIWNVEADMAERPRGVELIFAGDLNVDLESIGSWGQDKEITATVLMAGLEYLLGYFLPQWRACCKYRRT